MNGTYSRTVRKEVYKVKSTRQWLFLSFACGILLIVATFILAGNPLDWFSQQTATPESSQVNEKTFHIVTGEFKTTTDDGKELEVYRFSPGHLTVNKGDQVTLNIHGVNGHEHHFQLKEFGVSGTVERGKTTTVTFNADQAGTFELLCTNHATHEQGGPMVAYLTVLE